MKLFCLLLLCACSNRSFSQHYNFRNISTRDGLPGSLVYRAFEDAKGYLWYLTDKGIARFDGKEWKYFSSEDGFEEAGAFHIAQSKDGTLWFVTVNFKLYYYKDQRFHKIETRELIAWVDIDKDDHIWCLSRSSMILEMKPDFQLSPVYQFNTFPLTGFTLAALGENRFLVSTHMGIYLLSDFRCAELVLKTDVYTKHVTSEIFRKKNGQLLLTSNTGIYDFNLATKQLKLLVPIKNNEIYNFYEDSITHDAWMATFHGVYRFPSGVISARNLRIYLENNNISHIIKTSAGNYYFASLNNGVFSCNFKAKHIDMQDGLPDERITFIKKENGTIYLFTAAGRIFYLKNNKPVKLATNIPVFGEKGFIENVLSIKDSLIWILSDKAYILRDKKIAPSRPEYSSFIWGRMRHLNRCEIPIKELLPVTDTNHFFWSETIARFFKIRGLISRSMSIYSDRNFFYFQSDSGLLEIPYSRKPESTKPYLIHDLISDVISTDSGTFVIATDNKGILFIKDSEQKYLGAKDGLASDFCKAVYIKDHFIWVCTNKGLSRIAMDSHDRIGKITNFTSDDYLIDNEVNDLLFDSGNVYVATGKGVSFFRSDIVFPALAPKIYIENIQINNKDTLYQSSYTLPYDQNNINIFYKSPGLRSAEQTLYQYIITGSISDTGFTQSANIRYGSLLPGDYSFKIRARNVDGIWSESPAFVNLRIENPFWRTWWFILLVVILLAGIISYILHNKIRSNKKELEFKMKLIESDLKSLRLHMNPHFMFNSLTSLQSYILNDQNEEAEEYITGFSALLRSIMNYSIKGEITLYEEIKLLKRYLELEKMRFANRFNYEITCDPEIVVRDIVIPSLLIQPFAENAVRHGLTGLEREGILRIHFECREKNLYCIIEDNGHGRNQFPSHLNRDPMHVSSGIRFTRERISLLTKKLNENVVMIYDLHENNKPAGTKVEILVPLLNYNKHDKMFYSG